VGLANTPAKIERASDTSHAATGSESCEFPDPCGESTKSRPFP
jgi:hypothetical protein